jgi:hypothetical protein
MRRALSIVVLVTSIVACIVLAIKAQRWMQIDSCLDRGGKWNYAAHQWEQGMSDH